MMNTTSSQVRAAVLVGILAMVPASRAEAQVHKGQHRGKSMTQAAPRAAVAPVALPVKPIQPAATPKNPNGMLRQANAHHENPSNAALVSAMHSTMTHLNQLDHDYDGHRTRALHEISTAVRLLGGQGGQSLTGNAGLAQPSNATRAGTGKKVPQLTSDAHLREAQQSLQNLDSQMNINGVNSHQFTRAKASVQNAIRELNLALNDR